MRRGGFSGEELPSAARAVAFVPRGEPDMRKHIGKWLLALNSLAASLLLGPATAHAQDLRQWGTLPSVCAAANANANADALTATRPYTARAQDVGEGYFVPPVAFTGPLSHPRYEDGDGF